MSTLLSINMPLPVCASSDKSVISIKILSVKTRNQISTLLNPPKVIPTEGGLPRDWRGLAHLIGLKVEKIPVIACDTDPTAKVLQLWQKQENVPCNIKQFIDFLEEMDRFDIIEDTSDLIDEDIKNYIEKPPTEEIDPSPINDTDNQILTSDDIRRLQEGLDTQKYDAYVVFADEDIDFATKLIETMENEYGLKLCVKERDLVAGIAFEHRAIIELISERCNRLIVIISPAYLKSQVNKFVVNYAVALGIEQGRRKIIPCVFEKCELPQELKHFFTLDYTRSGKLWNFWERLRDSIQAPPASPRERKIAIQHVTYNSENLPDLKSVLVPPNRNHTRPKKEGVKFGSLSNLTIPEPDDNRLSASTNALYTFPTNSVHSDSVIEKKPKSKNKNWIKKLLHPKESKKNENKDSKSENKDNVDRLNINNKDKKKKKWLKTKLKVPVLNS